MVARFAALGPIPSEEFEVAINGIEGQENFTFLLRPTWGVGDEMFMNILLPAEDTHDRPILF